MRLAILGVLVLAGVYADPIDLTPAELKPEPRRHLLEMRDQAQNELHGISSKASGLHSHITELTDHLKLLKEVQVNKEQSRRTLLEDKISRHQDAQNTEAFSSARHPLGMPGAEKASKAEGKSEYQEGQERLSRDYKKKKHQGPQYGDSKGNTNTRKGNKRARAAKSKK